MTETPRILLVDDEEDLSFVTKLALERARGYDVEVEHFGVNVVDRAKQFKPDIIFLDFILPDVDGDEVVNRLSADAETCDIPVVFLTGLATHETEGESTVIGSHRFISKPASIGSMVDAVEENIKRR